MIKHVLFLFSIAVICMGYSQDGTIILTNENTGIDGGHLFTQQVLIVEDSERKMTAESVAKKNAEAFYQSKHDNPIVHFTDSRFWLRFTVQNNSDYTDFLIETARPITDTVIFFELSEGKVKRTVTGGDDYPYYDKEVEHRKNLFQFDLEEGQIKEFVIQVGSGGEGIILPVIIHEKMAFFRQDFKDQFKNGFYYGMIALVIVIYFFFFLLLKDNTFLFYILYVFFQGLLQFSLDGYSYHHFFPFGGYWVNRFPPLMGALAIVFMLVYVNKFLDLGKEAPGFRKMFWIASSLISISLVFTFIPGKLHVQSYPMVNAVSLLSIVLAVSSIFYLRFKGKSVDIYFTIAFLALITGAVIFILGNFNIIENSLLSLNALKVSSVVEFVILSISMSFKYRELQQDKEEAQARALKSLQEKNALMDQSNILLEKQVKERTKEIEWQKEQLAESNKEIVSSIKYAKRIQEAILPSPKQVKALLPDSFIFYRPKDVVSGDFYFVESTRTTERNAQVYTIFAAVDCTGHGVPGAFMSIVGNNFLSQSLVEKEVNSPGQALDFLNKGVSSTLRQHSEGVTVRDGMDMAMCALNHDHSEVVFAGAKNPLYLIRRKEEITEVESFLAPKTENEKAVLYQINGDKQPIGNSEKNGDFKFSDRKVKLCKGDQLFVFTDGFADQFGGERQKKYNYRRFRELLLKLSDKPMDVQMKTIEEEFDQWKSDIEQIDDVLILSVKI